MHRCTRTALIALVAAIAFPVAVVSQELVGPLAAFEPLVGTSWIGRFTSSPAPPFDHLIEWRAILDGQVVQWSKRVVEFENGLIALVGVVMQAWGIAESRQRFEIMPDGTLEDRYYSRAGTGWSPEHVIVYRPSPGEG